MVVYQNKDHYRLYILPKLLQSNLALQILLFQPFYMSRHIYLSMVHQIHLM
nr:MAG TPA: hypothetical protein [Caudoviricetes sp.]